ncbi:MAG TPA: M56 family metallopeptidase [Candidatus Eisenbacteria bacterium]|jgi:beta-lactamase regulating signal transducer with metallopeptidase domain
MSGSFMSLPGAVLILLCKVTAALAGGALVAALARGRPAAARHFVWLTTLASALALPLLAPIAPRVAFPVPTPERLGALQSPAIGMGSERIERDRATDASGTGLGRPGALATGGLADRPRPTWASSIAWGFGLLWLAGCLWVLLRCLLGHWVLARLHRAAVPVERGPWCALIGDVSSRRLLERGVRLAMSGSVATPLTWGWPRSVILLPREADSWPAERRRIVLLHELAHVGRGDYLAQWVATLTCAAYWFHPLVWLAASRLRSEGERACDDRVLAGGVPADEYASTLLDVARRWRALRRAELAGVAMARPSHLEGRLLAVLDELRPRGTVSRGAAVAALAAAALLVVPLAGLVPRRASANLRVDPFGNVASHVTRAVTRTANRVVTQAASEVAIQTAVHAASRTDPASTFERTVSTTAGRELRLDLETGGTVEIRGWDRPEVRVRARLAGKDWRDTRLEADRGPGGVVISSLQAGEDRSFSTSHAFEIQIPRRYDIWLSSGGGAVTIAHVEGTFRGQTGGGEIVLEQLRGRVRLATGGGDIQVSDSRLDGSVSTGGGMVKISNVRGNLRGSSGSGPVITSRGEGEDSDEDLASGDLSGVEVDDEHRHIGIAGDARPGFLRVRKAGGDVDLEEAPRGARITTGGGDIRVGRGAGIVEAQTGGGDIEIGPVAGSVHAGTGAGAVSVSLIDAGGSPQTVEITSGTGRVVVELPRDFEARFDLETAYTRSFGRPTRITSDWTLDRESTVRWEADEGTPRRYVRAKGVVGSERNRIRVRTVNGDIEVRRAHP